MIMVRYFVIDTEKDANKLKTLMSEYEFYLAEDFVRDYSQALNSILKLSPNLVFVNLDLPNLRPFDIITEVQNYLEQSVQFIAISKSKELAYEAFKHGCADYLISPFSELEIRKCVLRFKKKHKSTTSPTLCLKSYKDFQYLKTGDIVFLKADNNTTDFFLKDGSVVSSFKTLKVFQNILPRNFLRIHKSYIVNRDYVCRINYGKLKCSLAEISEKIPFTKTYINNIETITSSLSDISATALN